MPKPDQTSAPNKVVVIRDFTITGVGATLDGLVKRPPPGFAVLVPGGTTAPEQGHVWLDVIEPALRDADLVVALVDKPNANVGFEIGFALGCRKRVALAVADGKVPAWLQQPPLAGFLVQPVDGIDAWRRLIVALDGVAPPKAATPGSATLLLCPRAGEGVALHEELDEMPACKLWKRPDPVGWTVRDLHTQMQGVERVVWIVTPPRAGDFRDGRDNTAAAVLAGYASALGRKLVVLRHAEHREVIDVRHIDREFQGLEEFRQAIELVLSEPAAATPQDPLTSFRRCTLAAHAHLVPFFASGSGRLLDEVFVDLEVERDHLTPKTAPPKERHAASDLTLRGGKLADLLALPLSADNAGRFVVRGHPGAGKSTVLRHLAHQQAKADGACAIFASLVRLAHKQIDPFDLAEHDVRATLGDLAGQGLADLLRAHAKRQGGASVWLLLDGLDEVAADDVTAMRSRIESWADEYPQARVVVTSRVIGYQPLSDAFQLTRLRPLDLASQDRLLSAWLGATAAARVRTQVTGLRVLADDLGNPLLLTMLALVAKTAAQQPGTQRADLPTSRVALYRDVIDLLLRGAHRPEAESLRGVKSVDDAKVLLRALSGALQDAGGDAWLHADLCTSLWALRQDPTQDPTLEARLARVWQTNEQFLADVAGRSGVLAPYGGEREPWRFFHRSFREYFVADRLKEHDGKQLVQLVRAQVAAKDKDRAARGKQIDRWAEPCAMVCGLVERPAELILALKGIDANLARRALLEADSFELAEALALLEQIGSFDGEHVLHLCARVARERAIEVLLGTVTPQRELATLAMFAYALDTLGWRIEGDRRREFFTQAGRWPTVGEPAAPRVVEVRGGAFWMGSADGEGDGDEHPRHRVTLSPFALATTTVTAAEFAWLAQPNTQGGKAREAPAENLPAVDLSWYEAWLYCRFVGGRLPTEAEWKYACRAGTDTPWSCGKTERSLTAYAWFDKNSGNELHPVATKKPNAFGLYDMHGNVWEWCSDWSAGYASDPQRDPSGPERGSDRVIRGGGYWYVADGCRSAYRVLWLPVGRWSNLGFRVALPRPSLVIEDR